MKSIHIKDLWRGAIFALTQTGSPVVWYHCDFITDSKIHFTAIHNHNSYEKKLIDRYVWIRN